MQKGCEKVQFFIYLYVKFERLKISGTISPKDTRTYLQDTRTYLQDTRTYLQDTRTYLQDTRKL